MRTVKMTTKPTMEEKETLLHYDYVDKVWIMDSTISTHYNKALRQGWEPVACYQGDDGAVCGYVLKAPGRAITIRNVEVKQMSDKQMENLFKDDEE